jgi:hypothetical protein
MWTASTIPSVVVVMSVAVVWHNDGLAGLSQVQTLLGPVGRQCTGSMPMARPARTLGGIAVDRIVCSPVTARC